MADEERPEEQPEGQPQDEQLDAAAEALLRARAVAANKGFRPGMRPRRRARGVTPSVGSGSAASGRDPALIGDQVDRLLSERGWSADVSAGGVIGRWAEIVGAEVAANAEPTSFQDGLLTVRAASSAWATQLRMLSSGLLARLDDEVGQGVVRELKIVGPSAPSWKHGKLSATDGRGPRDTYG